MSHLFEPVTIFLSEYSFTMPLTTLYHTHFFTAAIQMGLSETQHLASLLAAQGLNTVDDFIDFDKDELDQALKNMHTSIPSITAVEAITNVDGVITIPAEPAVPEIPPIIIPAKSAHRLEVASIAWHNFTDISHSITSANMHYNNTLKNFHIEWKAISSMAAASFSDVPCIMKNNPPLLFTDTFMVYCLNTFGYELLLLLHSTGRFIR